MIFSHVIRRTLIVSSSWKTLITIIQYQATREELLPSLTNIFSSVGPNYANKLPPAQLSSGFLECIWHPYHLICFWFSHPRRGKARNLSHINLVIPDEVKQETSRIPNGKSHGLHSCPTKILLHIRQVREE